MKLISETATNKVIYAFSDGEEISITESGMTAGAIKALDIKPDTHQVIQTDVALPNAFVGGAGRSMGLLMQSIIKKRSLQKKTRQWSHSGQSVIAYSQKPIGLHRQM